MERLLRVMARLRAPGGCPWDREQTLESLETYLLEECYEVLDALAAGETRAHREELGDLLLQIVFQSEIRAEADEFDFAEVADAIHDKLIRRHPHVFQDGSAMDAAAVPKKWEDIKAQERHESGKSHEGRLDGVPKTAPALLQALRIGEKAAAAGFDWPGLDGPRDKVDEEWAELEAEIKSGNAAGIKDEMGDVLYAICNLSRHLGVDPEAALRQTLGKFRRRFRAIEVALDREDRRFEDTTLDRLEELWEIAKARERS